MANNKLYKGSLSTIILKLLEDEGKMYGYEITQKVKELTAGALQITEGALYPALHKLEMEGLLTVSYQKVNNRTRKYYALTPQGKSTGQQKLEELQAFVQQMQHLLNLKTN